MKNPQTIAEYTAQFPADVQKILRKIHKTIHYAIPTDAGEKISYGIPTFTYHGNLIHYAAFAHHIGIYPGSAAVVELEDRLVGYETSKGAIRFPLDKPIPYELIREITLWCIAQRISK